MKEDNRQEYYARLGIKPPSATAIDVKEEVLAHSEVEGVEVAEGVNDREHAAEGDIGVDARDEAAAEPAPFLGRRVASDPGSHRVPPATAHILALSLLGTKKVWVWVAVLICLVIAGYFLFRWYSGRDELRSPSKETVRAHGGDPTRDFLDDY